MDPQSGKWTGTFTTQFGTTVYIVLDLTFSRNTIKGSFNVAPLEADVWTGPRSGSSIAGTYSAAGNIHLEEDTDEETFGTASFDGVYAADGDSQVIQGNVIVTRGDDQQIGALVVYSAEALPVRVALAAHVWDP